MMDQTFKHFCETQIKWRSCDITWTIPDYNTIVVASGLLSSEFSADSKNTWKLKAYKSTYGRHSDLICEAILTESTNLPRIKGEISVLVDGKKENTISFDGQSKKGEPTIKWSAEFDRYASKSLTFHCEIKEVETVQVFNSVLEGSKPEHKLMANISRLRTDSTWVDVTFSVGGEEILAHKLILAAMSPVFEAMFKGATKENQTDRVEIVDIESHVFEAFLHYVYTGEVPGIKELATELMAPADKYNIETLKEICVTQMLTDLSVVNAVNIYRLADLYAFPKAKGPVAVFIKNHMSAIALTDGWVSLCQNYPNLVKEIRDFQNK